MTGAVALEVLGYFNNRETLDQEYQVCISG